MGSNRFCPELIARGGSPSAKVSRMALKMLESFDFRA
jgi:hypothetical protein